MVCQTPPPPKYRLRGAAALKGSRDEGLGLTEDHKVELSCRKRLGDVRERGALVQNEGETEREGKTERNEEMVTLQSSCKDYLLAEPKLSNRALHSQGLVSREQ
jgi:hypothetical protein